MITTGDGGMLTTAQPGAAIAQFRLLRQHGMSVPDTRAPRRRSEVIFEEYPELGFNYRMTDMQAAIGRVQLQRLPEIVARRRELAARYHELLAAIPGPAAARSSRPGRAATGRATASGCPPAAISARVMQAMLDEGISTRRGVMSAHREPAYQREAWRAEHRNALTTSEEISDDGLILPLFDQMTDEDQVRVATRAGARHQDGGPAAVSVAHPAKETRMEISDDAILRRGARRHAQRPTRRATPPASSWSRPEAPIFGPDSPLDSLGLVGLLLDIEEGLQAIGCDVVLSDERAVSQKRSPFRNVQVARRVRRHAREGMSRMAPRHVLITGTSRGIGEALAEHYLAAGDRVVGCGRSKSALSHERYTHCRARRHRRGRGRRACSAISRSGSRRSTC